MAALPLEPGAGDTSLPELLKLLDVLPAAAYTCNTEGLITYYNKRAADLWGRKPRLNCLEDRFCGSFRLFFPDGKPMKHDECWMAQALSSSRGYNGCDVMIERPDGRRLRAKAYANPIRDDSGRLIGALNILMEAAEPQQVA